MGGWAVVERLAPRIWKIVEDDAHGQIPFLYAAVGDDRVVVVDTGVGAAGDLLAALDEALNPRRLPYVVVCTHVHFDHVGGLRWFERHLTPEQKARAAADALAHQVAGTATTATTSSSSSSSSSDSTTTAATTTATAATAGTEPTQSGSGSSSGSGSGSGSAAVVSAPWPVPAEGGPRVLDVCMSAAARTFTANWELNSLAAAHSGAKVEPFTVTRWLHDGDVIPLGPADSPLAAELALDVLHTPGHTPDSLALYARWDNRLFFGDTLYPFTVVHLDCLGSSLRDFTTTIDRVAAFVRERDAQWKPTAATTSLPEGGFEVAGSGGGSADAADGTAGGDDAAAAAAAAAAASPGKAEAEDAAPGPTGADLTTDQRQVLTEFYATVGLHESQAEKRFSASTLMTLCDWRLEAAIDMYLSQMDDIPAMCPPSISSALAGLPDLVPTSPPPSGLTAEARRSPLATRPGDGTTCVISAGHVEANLAAAVSLQTVQAGLHLVAAGTAMPSLIDEGYAEYNLGEFVVCASVKDTAALGDRPFPDDASSAVSAAVAAGKAEETDARDPFQSAGVGIGGAASSSSTGIRGDYSGGALGDGGYRGPSLGEPSSSTPLLEDDGLSTGATNGDDDDVDDLGMMGGGGGDGLDGGGGGVAIDDGAVDGIHEALGGTVDKGAIREALLATGGDAEMAVTRLLGA